MSMTTLVLLFGVMEVIREETAVRYLHDRVEKIISSSFDIEMVYFSAKVFSHPSTGNTPVNRVRDNVIMSS